MMQRRRSVTPQPHAPHHHGHVVSHVVLVTTLFAIVCVAMLTWTLPRRKYSHIDDARRHALDNVIDLPAPPVVPHGPISQEDAARQVLSTLKNGTDYMADYDINVVDEPEVLVPGKHYHFHYPTPATTKHPYKLLSKFPRIYMFPEFITDAEADAMIAKANSSMSRSLVDQKEDGGVSDIRTSTQTWLNVHEPPVASVAERLRDLTGIQDHESLQVLRYGVGQRYGAHPDYFKVEKGGHFSDNRAATCYIYLSDVEEGGETAFPRADGKLIPRPFTSESSCANGLRVRPKKRTLVLFYDMTPDGAVDAHSLHAACPVKKGVKWGFTLWMHVKLNISQTDQPVVGFDF